MPLDPRLHAGYRGADRFEVAAPVGAAAVRVGDAVRPRQLPGTGEVARAGEHLLIGRQRGDSAAEEERRLGLEKVDVLLAALAPALLGHSEVLEHRLRP